MKDADGGWDKESLQARVSDAVKRVRHPAGSPDQQELTAYAFAFPDLHEKQAAVVLGMTPELRRLAIGHFNKIYSVDASVLSIRMYRDWVDEEDRSRETVIHDNWLSLSRHIPEAVSTVLGDGVFGNLTNIEEHRTLLAEIRGALVPGGHLITRKAMIPDGFVSSEADTRTLLRAYRHGDLDLAEFGFAVRLLGHHACCYNPETGVLDNRKLFAECEALWREGRLTDSENAGIRRYFFSGRNCIVRKGIWEQLLRESGFRFQIRRCTGRHWYSYYCVYEAIRR